LCFHLPGPTHTFKGYALQELHRLPEAKAAIQFALSLSPTNSHYLNELGAIYQLEKNWPKAKETFVAAEDNATLSRMKSEPMILLVPAEAWATCMLSLGN